MNVLLYLRERGACRDADPALFNPPYDSPSANAAAIKICHTCSVKAECLDWAMEHGEVGVWGATGEADRRALLRKRARVTCVGCGSEQIEDDFTPGYEVCGSCGLSWAV